MEKGLNNIKKPYGFAPINAQNIALRRECEVYKMYKTFVKRIIDVFLSFIGMIVLIPVFMIVAIVIYIDDPGPIFFKQKRVGKDKSTFWLYKFRSMKVKTPDIPTHMLDNPEQYITRVGKIIRKLSIDELPQVFDILIGKMTIIGPRPALWSQDDLIFERDKYGANDVKPGLTGWAQINGRDELPINIKAKFDGEYAEKLNCGGFVAFFMDCKCFAGTILKVIKSDGVVEGNRSEKTKDKKVVFK